jgi:hypothetical protein
MEVHDTEVRRLPSTRAATVIELKLIASYASTEAKLADSIVEDILQF